MRAGGRRRVIRLVAFLLLLSLLLPVAAVQFSSTAEPVVVWHGFTAATPEADAVDAYVQALAAARPRLNVQVRAIGEQFGGAVAQAIGSGLFPDVLLAPAEWISLLDHIGLLAAVSVEDLDEYLPGVAAGVTSYGFVMGVPAFTSVPALGRRPAPADGPAVDWPTDVQALVRAARDAAAAGRGGLHWPLDDLYYSVPWLLGAGGYLEPPAGTGSGTSTVSPDRLVADDAVRAWLGAVAQVRAVAQEAQGVDLVDAWLAGKVAYAVITPGVHAALRGAGEAIEVGPIPQGRGYLSTWVWMLSGYPADPRPEAVKLLARIQAADDQGGPSLALTIGHLPVKTRHFLSPVAVERGLGGFLAAAEAGLPMPAGPLAPEMWAIYELALQEFLAGAKAETVLASLKGRAGELYPPERAP